MSRFFFKKPRRDYNVSLRAVEYHTYPPQLYIMYGYGVLTEYSTP